MARISLRHYLMGRDVSHALDLTPEIIEDAAETVGVVNELLAEAEADGIEPAIDELTGTHVASGWRPPAINDRTANAAKGTSTHLTALGVDLEDHDDRRLARWCIANLWQLEKLGLFMEDPRFTGGRVNSDPWCHLQRRAPSSRRRVFVPSSAPPTDPGFFERYAIKRPK